MRQIWLIRLMTWLMRIVVGGVFIFSGFVKSIDPWGTLYKFEDYLGALGLDLWPNLVLTGIFALCAVEFLTGVMLLMGCFRRTIPVVTIIIMGFMLPLTLWIAVADPVADCGCFGDALIISNWATFWKNVVLTLAAVWLLKFNPKARWLVTPALQWIAFVVSAAFILTIETIGYIYQPLIDFRAYPEGSPIADFSETAESDGEREFVFIYEKDGVRKEVKESDPLPDESEGWTFIDRVPASGTGNASPKDDLEKGFRIWDEEGLEDLTDEVTGPESGRQLFILMPDLRNVSTASSWRINSLYTWATRNNIDMLDIVNGSVEDIDEWKDLSMAEYPIYTADDTSIKEVARGNPAVVFAENGNVVWKSTLRSLPIDDFLSPDTSDDPLSFRRDDHRTLMNLSLIFISVLAVLVVLSFLPRLQGVFKNSRYNREQKEETDQSDVKANKGEMEEKCVTENKTEKENQK